MSEISFDLSYHYDENLHDVPNNADETRQAVEFWQSQLSQSDIDTKGRIKLLGLIGGYARTLKNLAVAQQALTSAVELSEDIGDKRLRTANLIRLAHVYQWRRNYQLSEKLFEEAIGSCQNDVDLAHYLDFAYQHRGKCKFDQQQYEAAQYYFEQAMELRLKKGDQSLIDSTRLAINTVKNRKGSAGK